MYKEYAISLLQTPFWVVNQIAATSTAPVGANAIRIRTRVDAQHLRQAWSAFTERHEMLRTTFHGSDVVVQRTHDAGSFTPEFNFHDVRGISEAELIARVRADYRRPFDLTVNSIRASLYTRADDDHVLLVAHQHIAFDLGAIELMHLELPKLVAAYREGRAAVFSYDSPSFSGYVDHERRLLEGSRGEQLRSFWSDYLSGVDGVLALPTDRQRRGPRAYAAESYTFHVSHELTSGLGALSTKLNTSLFRTMLAAYAVFLFRQTGKSDFIVSTPADCRTPEFENGVGNFINVLPLRMRCAADQTFEEILASVSRSVSAAGKHRELPFLEILELTNVPRDPKLTPLYQTSFRLNGSRRVPAAGAQGVCGAPWRADLEGLQCEAFPLSILGGNVDLEMVAVDVGGKLYFEFQYAGDLFERESIVAMAERFCTLLDSIVAHSNERADRLAFLPERERALTSGWNDTRLDYPGEDFIHEVFEKQAALTPHAIAIEFEEQRVTYADLDANANRLAHWLVSKGVGAESCVGVLMDRSVEMVVALYAILKAGGAYVPLDPDLPKDRLASMVETAGVAIVLAQPHTRGRAPGETHDVIALAAELRLLPSSRPGVRIRGGQPAYLIYTSGSTGTPKGVLNTHEGIRNRLLWMQDAFALTTDDCVLQKTPFSFDVSVWEFFWPLMFGARLVVARPGDHRDPGALVRLIASHRVTTLHFVPSMLGAFLEEADAVRCPTVRRVICSGEALTPELCRRYRERIGAELHNLYGPTEAAVDVTWWDCSSAEQSSIVPIGRPIANTSVFVLDQAMNEVPPGASGELFLGGIQLARGYAARPDLTAERFVPHPFSSSGARLYRTGDLARFRRDGAVEYLGRIDHQVKIRGFRIELGEIESVLSAHPSVREVVVVAREGAHGDKRIVAYLVAADPSNLDLGALRDHVQRKLPEYMVPSAFVALDALPLNPSGKIDRNALPAPERTTEERYVAPRTPMERTIAAVWEDVLGVERIGLEGGFFSLGGNSLLAMKAVSRLRELGTETLIKDIYESPSLGDFAARAQAGQIRFEAPPNLIPSHADRITPAMVTLCELTQEEIDQVVNRIPGGASNVQDIYPLTPLQEGFLFHHLMAATSGRDTYVDIAILKVSSIDQLPKVMGRMQAAVERYDILRTAVVWEQVPRPVQVVVRNAMLQTSAVDIPEGVDASQKLLELGRSSTQSLDFSAPPLMRAFTARSGDVGFIMLLMHHVVIDNLFLRTLNEELLGDLAERPRLPFRTYVAYTLDRMAAPAEAERYFREELAGFTSATVPFGVGDVHDADPDKGHSARIDLGPPLTKALRAFCSSLSVSPAAAFHVAWATVLARCSGQRDVVFGTITSGRSAPLAGIDTAAGMFLNTVPVRIRLEGRTIFDVMSAAHAALGRTVQHEHIPMPIVQGWSEVQPSTPLVLSVLNVRHARTAAVRSPGMLHIDWVAFEELTNYPLTADVDEDEANFSVTVSAAEPISAPRVAEYFRAAVDQLVALGSGAQIEALDILSDGERETLLVEWKGPGVEYSSRCVHELIEDHARTSPEATAVVSGTQSWSYAALNRRANQIARWLRLKGVGIEDRVVTWLPRSADNIAAQIATWKVGAAFVPIDPGTPAERAAFVIADVAAKVVLTASVLADEAIARESVDDLALAPSPSRAAYVIYTSGSTGAPKGTVAEHRSLSNCVGNSVRIFELTSADRASQFASPAFDASISEIWPTLAAGAALHLVDEDVRQSPTNLIAWLRSAAITVAFLPTQLAEIAFDEDWAGMSLRVLQIGGQALHRRPPCNVPFRLLNNYGPTETTDYVTVEEVASGNDPVTTIGRPVPNTSIFILDAQARPTPIGVYGELHVGGANVTRGYFGRPDLTAERFVPDGFGPIPGARLYRTGDRGRWLADGRIEFAGRIDDQVKVRGFRIELGEIESVLSGHPAVREAVVLARDDSRGDKRIVAYVVAEDPQSLDIDALREDLQRKLPEYMVPSAFVALEAFPLSTSGKVERKALPAPEHSTKERYLAPTSPVEVALAQIWCDILKVERVGVDDDFFELGGHSLSAMQVLSRIGKALDVQLPIRVLFEARTVARLASWLAARQRAEHISDTPPSTQSTLIKIQDGSDASGVVCVHALNGDVFSYGALAPHLSGGATVYGLRASDLPVLPDTVEALARIHAASLAHLDMRRTTLCGWSAGGVIAYEVAIQLQLMGRPPTGLILLDSYLLRPSRRPSLSLLQYFDSVVAEGGVPEKARRTIDAARSLPVSQREVALERAIGEALGIEENELRNRVAVFSSLTMSVEHYEPDRVFDGPTYVVSATPERAKATWGTWLPRAECITVTGDHYRMLRSPDVQALGRALGLIVGG